MIETVKSKFNKLIEMWRNLLTSLKKFKLCLSSSTLHFIRNENYAALLNSHSEGIFYECKKILQIFFSYFGLDTKATKTLYPC